ncbi:MAG: cytochrome b/b6 domain-containing protein [Pseudomonadota bacterium]|nr:cytochrome b/b6 domain-containing protein [Pseudomonadota bacterium]
MKNENTSGWVRVWDLPTRLFHWSLVTAFLVAYTTEDDLLTVHNWAGYFVLALVVFRVVWGFTGPRYARFADFVHPLPVVRDYLKETMAKRAPRYLGHNPAGGAMIVLLLIGLVPTAISGMAVYAAEENAGPLAFWLGGAGEGTANALSEAHEIIAHATMLLIIFHVIGVVVASRQHGENLVRAMVTGMKRREP